MMKVTDYTTREEFVAHFAGWRIQAHVCFDSLDIGGPGKTVFQDVLFFDEPYGHPISPPPLPGQAELKPIWKTNMVRPHSLPQPNNLLVERIHLAAGPGLHPSDYEQLCRRSWELVRDDRIIARGHLILNLDITTAERIGVRLPPQRSFECMPFVIQPHQVFRLTVRGEPFTAYRPIQLFAALEGVMAGD